MIIIIICKLSQSATIHPSRYQYVLYGLNVIKVCYIKIYRLSDKLTYLKKVFSSLEGSQGFKKE